MYSYVVLLFHPEFYSRVDNPEFVGKYIGVAFKELLVKIRRCCVEQGQCGYVCLNPDDK